LVEVSERVRRRGEVRETRSGLNGSGDSSIDGVVVKSRNDVNEEFRTGLVGSDELEESRTENWIGSIDLRNVRS